MTTAEERKYQFYLSVLKEIAKEYHTNTNVDTIINSVEAQLKNFKNKQ